MERKHHTIDATNQAVGRLATQIARILIGKHRVGWRPHVDSGDFVRVTNLDKLKFTGKKLEQKMYYHYSGYPGGMKTKAASALQKTDPGFILRMSVKRMLPKNTHLVNRLKRLQV